MSRCIVSVGVGGWYPKGVSRLERSLIHHGWSGDLKLWKGEYPPGSPTHQEQPYAFKIAAIRAAHEAGHDQVLWLDSSAWAIGNPNPVFDIIETQGHYLWTSGYKCSTWCNDKSLNYFDTSREQARELDMIYALVLGLDFRNDRAVRFFDWWAQSMEAGLFKGPWKREEGDPEPPEYEGHRHDQSAASLIAHKLGMEIDGTHSLCHLYEPNMPETVRLTFQGI